MNEKGYLMNNAVASPPSKKALADKKQRIVLLLTSLAMVFLCWQIYDMFWGGESMSDAPAPVVVAKRPVVTNSKPTLVKKMPAKKTVQSQPITQQAAYLSVVDQLEMAKLQAQLLQQQAAIASARQRIAQMNQKTSELGGALSASSPVMSGQAGYQLKLLDHDHGAWEAVLIDAGHYRTVTVGAVLPGGDIVKAIDATTVTLAASDGTITRLRFEG